MKLSTVFVSNLRDVCKTYAEQWKPSETQTNLRTVFLRARYIKQSMVSLLFSVGVAGVIGNTCTVEFDFTDSWGGILKWAEPHVVNECKFQQSNGTLVNDIIHKFMLPWKAS